MEQEVERLTKENAKLKRSHKEVNLTLIFSFESVIILIILHVYIWRNICNMFNQGTRKVAFNKCDLSSYLSYILLLCHLCNPHTHIISLCSFSIWQLCSPSTVQVPKKPMLHRAKSAFF